MAFSIIPHRAKARLRVLRLEERTTPAQFGVPWTDPLHLTLSFAPDGTPAAGASSTLFAALDAQMPRPVWQDAILRGFQAWAEAADVNLGFVTDGGQPFGDPGPTQGDPRFGDIRIGGVPMTPVTMAEAIPPSGFVSGTLAGDVFINTATPFTAEILYAVALHEAGHALGLPHSPDASSVMFSHLNTNTALSADDLAAIRALYGPRSPDANEGSKGNDTIKTATSIEYPALPPYDGSTPLVAYGDITTRSDVDVFAVAAYPGYAGPVSVRLLTAGVSLVGARLTVMTASGQVLAQATGSGNQGDDLTVTLPTASAAATYYLRIDAPGEAEFGVGRYALAVTFDGLLQPTAVPLDAVLRGPYESLHPEEIRGLFQNPGAALFADDAHIDDKIGRATILKPGPRQPSDTHLQATASLADAADVDFYQVKTPDSPTKQPWVLTTTVRAVSPHGVAPRVEILDDKQIRVPAQILVNGNGTYSVQTVGVPPGRTYYFRVFGTGAGNYALDVIFGRAAADLTTFASGTLPAPTSTATSRLYIGKTQLFSLALSANGPVGIGVRMEIVDGAGHVVSALTAAAGDTVTGVSTVLTPGEYTVRYTAIGTSGPVGFTVRGSGLTDPIGPVIDSATLTPQYQAAQDPTLFLYPDGTLTLDPYLWLVSFIA